MKSRLLILICWLWFSLVLAAQVFAINLGDIVTVAGGGVFPGDGGAATRAGLYYADGVAVDSSGNLYVAEEGSNRIRKVAAGTGIITTVAGNGNAGYSGDGGAATSASINGPVGVAVDSSGNLYIADTNNNRIRKVAAGTGIITTVAGNGTPGFSGDSGAATSAALLFPHGVAVTASGDLYIADHSNSRIRKVAAGSGIITTVAGNGAFGFSGDRGAATSAALFYPYSVAVASTGNLYIADMANDRVRMVSAGSGIITTVAGNGTNGFSGDGGVATLARLNAPTSVALDSAGNLYIADAGNSRIRRVAAGTGIITTVAGNGILGFSGDGGAATSAALYPFGVIVDSVGNLYVSDRLNNRVREIVRNNISTTTSLASPSEATVNYGTSVPFTATVASDNDVLIPSGAVTFFDGATALGTATLNDAGQAIFTTSTLTPGSHNITANFPASGILAASTSAALPITVMQFQKLTVALSGTGGGTVTSSPTGIACINGGSSGCSGTFSSTASVTLMASPDSNSTFGGWGGDCDGSGPCSVGMTSDRSVTATFAAAPKVKIGSSAYDTLLAACTAPINGSTILARDIEFAENVVFASTSTVILRGGYDATFSCNSGNYTTINGSLLIRRGCLTLDRVQVR